MDTQPHLLGKLDFEVTVPDLDLAMHLRPRLEALVRDRAPEAIARVCDAMGISDAVLAIDRLDLDLGYLGHDRLEEDVLTAFEGALADALAAALHDARFGAGSSARLIPTATGLLESFEAFLTSGIAIRTAPAHLLKPAAMLRNLAENDPDGLVAMLRRLRGNARVLERLTLQGGAKGLRQLLGLLAPAAAATILALLVDLRLAHRAAPIAERIDLAEPVLERLLWVTTLEFLLQDAGSQFNRRRFLDFLLQREARRLGIDYDALLALFDTAISRMREHLGIRSSLPLVLGELLAERRPALDEGHPPPDTGSGAALAAAQSGDFEALLAWARRCLGNEGEFEALVGALSPALFTGLIRRIEPMQADLILAVVDELAILHREAGLPVPSGKRRWLRAAALRLLLAPGHKAFVASRFLADLLKADAKALGIEYAQLVRDLATAIARGDKSGVARTRFATMLTEAAGGPAGGEASLAPLPDSLETALAEALKAAHDGTLAPLLALLRGQARLGRASVAPIVDRMTATLFRAVLYELLPAQATEILAEIDRIAALHRAVPLAWMDEDALKTLLREIVLALALREGSAPLAAGDCGGAIVKAFAGALGVTISGLRRAMMRAVATLGGNPQAYVGLLGSEMAGTSPSSKRNGDIAAAVLQALHRSDVRDLAKLLGREIDNLADMIRLAAIVDRPRREAIVALLAGNATVSIRDSLQALGRLHAAGPLIALDAASFELLLWIETLRFLTASRGTSFDKRRFDRHLLHAIARQGNIAPERLAVRLKHGATSSFDPAPIREAIGDFAREHTDTRPDTEQMRALAHFLRTGQPPTAGRGLVLLAERDLPQLARLVRRVANDMPGDIRPMLTRLLDWLLPGEVLDCLTPGGAAPAMRWAEAVGLSDAAAWSELLASILRDEVPDFSLPPQGFGSRLDRLALASHWLDHGVVAWWAPRGATAASVTEDIARLSLAEVSWLLAAGDTDGTTRRLRRVLDAITPALGESLLARLVPWAVVPGGPLASRLGRIDPDERRALLLRAAAVTLEGSEFDLSDLTETADAVEPFTPLPPPPGTAVDDRAALFAWLDGAPASSAEARGLARLFARLADRNDEELIEHIRARRAGSAARMRWKAILPPEALGRLVSMLVPTGADEFVEAALLIANAWRRITPFGAPRPDPNEVWAQLLDLLAEPALSLPLAIRRLTADLVGGVPQRAADLRAETAKLARQGGHVAVAAALRRADMPQSARAVSAQEAPPEAARPSAEAPRPDAPSDEPDHAIYIGNAGLALIAPFLPTLFQRLELLSTNDKGKPAILGLEAQSRAVHLLQYLVDARLDQPEPMLTFNKLLCGLPTGTPMMSVIDASRETLDICDSLLRAVIENWTIIGGTSIAGLRETFLQREGRLLHGNAKWELRVQRKGLDVLVDRIPWSISNVFHRWMAEPIQVTW